MSARCIYVIALLIVFFIKQQTTFSNNTTYLEKIPFEFGFFTDEKKDTIIKDSSSKNIPIDSTQIIHTCVVIPDSSLITFFHSNDFHQPIGYKLSIKDSALDYIHRHRLNYCKIKNFSHLGNIGSAIMNREYMPVTDLSLTFSRHAFTDYFYTIDSNKIYDCKHPFSELFYIAGPKKEQIFKIIHNQPITKNLTAGLDYSLLNSQGRYVAQGVNNSHFSAYAYFSTKKESYKFLWNYIHNKIAVSENGGILGYKEEYPTEKNDAIPVQLTPDKFATNRIKESVFFLEQSVKLWKASANNEYSPVVRRKYAAGGSLSHTFQYKKQRLAYEHQQDSTFYDTNHLSTTQSYDSTIFQQIQNTISFINGFVYNKKTQKAILLNLFAKHDGALVRQYGINHKFYRSNGSDWFEKGNYKPLNNFLDHEGQQISIGDYLNIDFPLGFQIIHNLEYLIYGLNNNDLLHKLILEKHFRTDSINKVNKISIEALTVKRHPTWFEQKHISNHFEWFNRFAMSTTNSISASYQRKNLNLTIALHNINNNIYFDQNAFPQQNDKNINIISAKLFKRWHIWKFGLDINLIYQNIDNDSTYKLPELTSINSIYFSHELIKKVLWIHTGADLTYFTAYYANAYMPATRQFYLQDNELIGNYPYIDVFLNFKLKKARFYLKIEHINSGLSGYNYYLVPNYPVYERGLVFGFQWLLY